MYKRQEQVSLRAGSLIEPLMMAMHAVGKARLGYGKRVDVYKRQDMDWYMAHLPFLAL